ncbi:hypothetical protein [Pseudothermotoga sp.]
MLRGILLGLVLSSVGLIGASLLTWLGLVSFANINLVPFSFVNALTTLGLLFMYNSVFEASVVRDFLIYVVVAFFFHAGRLSVLLEAEDKRLRVFFLSAGHTKNEYVLNYLFRRAMRKNIASLLLCWGLLSLTMVLRNLNTWRNQGFWVGVFLLSLGVTYFLLDRKH